MEAKTLARNPTILLEKLPVGRKEDYRLLTGKGRFTDDQNFENQAYMGLVLSTEAHARIKRIDLSKLRNSPEYIDSITGEDLIKEGVRSVTQNPWPKMKAVKRYHLAVGKVRFVGEPLAAILVKKRESLEDLIELVEVEYEKLPVVISIKDSKSKKALLYDDWEDNLIQSAQVKEGDADAALNSAKYVIEAKIGISRQTAVPIEPHIVLAKYLPESKCFEIISTQQSAHGLQGVLSNELDLEREKLHVRVLDVGGGFGSKGGPSYPWPLLACILSRRTGLPVKCVVNRTEEFLNANAGRDEHCELSLACDSQGRILALKARVECDSGLSATQLHMPSLTLWTMCGPYDIPNKDLEAKVYVTNKMPIGPLRGAGAPEGCYFIERAMDIMALRIGQDPLEFRRRNLSKSTEKNGNALLDTLANAAEFKQLLLERSAMFSESRGSQEKNILGLGFSLRAFEEEEETPWSSDDMKRDSQPRLSFTSEYARVEMDNRGRLKVYTGSSPHGQGLETSLAQLASEEFDLPLEMVSVIFGDTHLVPMGIGTFGSRSAVVGGSSVLDASRKLKSKILDGASKILHSPADSLRLNRGAISSRGKSLITLEDLFQRQGWGILSSDSIYDVGSVPESGSVHVCALTLDPETGIAKITKYLVVEDCGRMINRIIVDGQLHGGVVHGLGGALIEKLEYDDDANMLSTTLLNYDIPSATDSPDVRIFHVSTPSSAALDGARGVGESGTIGAYGAAINALNDAISQIKPGIRENDAPATFDLVFSKSRGQ